MIRYLLICIFFITGVLNQFIFDKNALCRYKTAHGKTLTFINQTYRITSRRRDIYFSPCNSPLRVAGCDTNASVCIIDKRSSQDSVKNAGSGFHLSLKDGDSPVFKTISGGICSSNKRYSTTISFDCNENKVNPRLTSDEDIECEYEITMMNDDCQIPCATMVNGNLIDLRFFRSKTITVKAQNSSDTLLISLCGAVLECGNIDVAGCDITKNINIGRVSSQHLVYNEYSQTLIVRSRFKYGNKKTDVRLTDVTLKCNWQHELSTPFYRAFGGKNYKIEIESKYGCIKLPRSCQVRGHSGEMYNFESLHKINENYAISNHDGVIFVNICGPMAIVNSLNDSCSATNSQVCLKRRGGDLENWGSIFGNFEEISSGLLFLSISSGDICQEDVKELRNTLITFKCSFVEKGPVFEGSEKCTLKIVWETPTACPTNVIKSSEKNCYLVDEFGRRNVSGLHSDQDKILSISSSTLLRYNLCGPLKQSCAGYTNTSACLKKNNKEYVMGWTNNELISNDGHLSLNLQGPNCNNINMKRQVNVNFYCDHSTSIDGSYSVKTISDNCLYNMTVKTTLACLSQLVVDCVAANNTHSFDLSALTSLTSNYVVRDPNNNNVEYYINICRPVLNQNIFCMNNTSVCMKNLSEPIFKDRFKSFGMVQNPIVENGEVIIRNSGGNLCDIIAQDYSSVVRFICSKTEESPQILKKNNCSVEFVWRTKHACPKILPTKTRIIRSCIFKDFESGQEFDFSMINHSKLKISVDPDPDRFLVLNFCLNNYLYCLQNNCTTLSLQRKIMLKENEKYLSFEMNNNLCRNNNAINKVNIKLLCGKYNTLNYTKESFNNCEVLLKLWIPYVCDDNPKTPWVDLNQKKVSDSRKENEIYKINNTSTNDIANTKVSNYVSVIKNCTIFNSKTGSYFNLSSIKPMTLTLSGINYSVDFGSATLCYSFLCSNSVPLTINKCPDIEFNYPANTVRLLFAADGNYKVDTILKCPESNNEDSYVTSINNDSIIFVINSSYICKFFIIEASTSTIFGTLSGCTIVIILVALFFGRRKILFCLSKKYHSITDVKENVHLYCRNVQE